MYAQRSGAVCTAGAACLAPTGGDVAQIIFLVVAAAVLLIAGFTLINLFRARPAEVMTGPQPRWYHRKR